MFISLQWNCLATAIENTWIKKIIMIIWYLIYTSFHFLHYVCFILYSFDQQFFPINYIDKVINLWIKMLDLFSVCLKKNTENT